MSEKIKRRYRVWKYQDPNSEFEIEVGDDEDKAVSALTAVGFCVSDQPVAEIQLEDVICPGDMDGLRDMLEQIYFKGCEDEFFRYCRDWFEHEKEKEKDDENNNSKT